MANQQAATPPPSSPRAPKIQQQSWDDCGSPPIDLYDPNNTRESPPPLSPLALGSMPLPPPRSPKGTRKLPTLHDPTGSGSPGPKRIVRKLDSTHSEPAASGDYYSPTAPATCGGGGVGSAGSKRIQNNHTGSLGEARSPFLKSPNNNSSRSFVFDEAIAPKYEKKIDLEIYENLNREDNCPVKSTRKRLINRNQFLRRNFDRRSTASDEEPLDEFPFQQLSNCSEQQHKRHSIVAESIISCESEVSTTSTFVCSNQSEVSHVPAGLTTNTPANGMSAGVCGGAGCPPTTNTTITTAGLGGGAGTASIERNKDLATTRTPNESDEDNAAQRSKQKRRLAINITSNPGYQAIHKSHHALDRTCSDSVVTRRRSYRKSTSDLTEADSCETFTMKPQQQQPPSPRRRGSSKGGLAYLASRRERGSRDSIRSNASNASVFSNEDIGPLAFQASERGRQRRTSNFLELPVPDHIRPRVCSLPERPYNPRQSDDLYRLRTFSISKGTVVNCGDSIISRRSRSNTSVNSTASRASERSPSCCGGYTVVDSMPPSPTDSEAPAPRYRVVMLGEASVGKTALVSQFMTSEYMHTYDASLDDEFGEKSVSVLLDGEESEMVFIDHPSTEMSVENSLSTYEPHCCVVVYSVVARNSFRVAEEIINYLWRENITKDKSVILVGNKADLARARVITTVEGKALAQSRDVKFIETSSGIQHNVDELLVGVLKQVRLKETRDKKAANKEATKMRSSRTHISLHMAKEILQKICLSDISKSKSCENLHVL